MTSCTVANTAMRSVYRDVRARIGDTGESAIEEIAKEPAAPSGERAPAGSRRRSTISCQDG